MSHQVGSAQAPATPAVSSRGRRSARLILRGAGVVVSLAALVGSLSIFFLHLALAPVLTGSMRPTYGPGWAVIAKPEPVSAVRPGQIVLFRPPGYSSTFAHRVVTVSGSPQHPVITTKGDANPAVDPWHSQLQGPTVYRVVAAVPALGYLFAGHFLALLRPLLLAAVGLGVCLVGVRAILGHGSPDKGYSST